MNQQQINQQVEKNKQLIYYILSQLRKRSPSAQVNNTNIQGDGVIIDELDKIKDEMKKLKSNLQRDTAELYYLDVMYRSISLTTEDIVTIAIGNSVNHDEIDAKAIGLGLNKYELNKNGSAGLVSYAFIPVIMDFTKKTVVYKLDDFGDADQTITIESLISQHPSGEYATYQWLIKAQSTTYSTTKYNIALLEGDSPKTPFGLLGIRYVIGSRTDCSVVFFSYENLLTNAEKIKNFNSEYAEPELIAVFSNTNPTFKFPTFTVHSESIISASPIITLGAFPTTLTIIDKQTYGTADSNYCEYGGFAPAISTAINITYGIIDTLELKDETVVENQAEKYEALAQFKVQAALVSLQQQVSTLSVNVPQLQTTEVSLQGGDQNLYLTRIIDKTTNDDIVEIPANITGTWDLVYPDFNTWLIEQENVYNKDVTEPEELKVKTDLGAPFSVTSSVILSNTIKPTTVFTKAIYVDDNDNYTEEDVYKAASHLYSAGSLSATTNIDYSLSYINGSVLGNRPQGLYRIYELSEAPGLQLILTGFPSDALPLTSSVQPVNGLTISHGNTTTTVNGNWTSANVIQNGVERIQVQGVFDLIQGLNAQGVMVILPSWIVPNQTKLVTVEARSSGETRNVTRQFGFEQVTVSNDAGESKKVDLTNLSLYTTSLERRPTLTMKLNANHTGGEIPTNAKFPYSNIPLNVISSNNPNYIIVSLLDGMDGKEDLDDQFPAQLYYGGTALKIQEGAALFDLRYISDPLLIGAANIQDQDLYDLDALVYNLYLQVQNLQRLIEDLDARVTAIEAALKQQAIQGLISQGIDAITLGAGSAWSVLIGLAVGFVSEYITIAEMVQDGVSLAGVMDTVLFFIQLVFHARQLNSEYFPKNNKKVDQIRHASTQTINDRNAIKAHDNISIGSGTESMDSTSSYSYGSIHTQSSAGSMRYIPEGSDTEHLINEEGSVDSFVNNYSNHVKNASVSSNEHTIYIQAANNDASGDYYDLQIVTATSGNYSGKNKPITGDSATMSSDGNRPGSLLFRYRPDENNNWKLQPWKESGVMKRSEIMAAVKVRDFENFSDDEIQSVYEQLATLHLSRRVASKDSEVMHTSVTATYTESKAMEYLHNLISKSRMRYNYGIPNYGGKEIINGIKSLITGGAYPGPWCPKSSYQTYISQMSSIYE